MIIQKQKGHLSNKHDKVTLLFLQILYPFINLIPS